MNVFVTVLCEARGCRMSFVLDLAFGMRLTDIRCPHCGQKTLCRIENNLWDRDIYRLGSSWGGGFRCLTLETPESEDIQS